MSTATMGRHRRLLCQHPPTPTGTVAWPDEYVPGATHASVYSCSRRACVADAADWVREKTGHLGTYREFTDGAR